MFSGREKSGAASPGRSAVSEDIRALIRRMSRENPNWGAPRIHCELLSSASTWARPASTSIWGALKSHRHKTWRSFLENYLQSLASIDFFTVPTIRLHILYVFLVLAHERRRIAHLR